MRYSGNLCFCCYIVGGALADLVKPLSQLDWPSSRGVGEKIQETQRKLKAEGQLQPSVKYKINLGGKRKLEMFCVKLPKRSRSLVGKNAKMCL